MFENLFESPLALIGLVLIPVLIILYLLKPKPKDYNIPTLMFLMDIEKRERLRSLLKKLIKDPVLLFQILIIGLLVFAVASPFYTTEAEAVSGNIILIIDSSASMLSEDVEQDRFSVAINEAKEIINNKKITIITSSDTWKVQLKEGTDDEAIKILNNLKAKDTGTNIAYTMLSASDAVNADSKEKTIMYVISDFAGTDVLENVLESKSKLESREIIVNLKKIGVNGKNIGIVDVESYRKGESNCLVKCEIMNFNEKDEDVEILINNKKIKKININPNSGYAFSKEINCKDEQEIKININPLNTEDDLLKIDNAVSFTAPDFKKILFISDDNKLKSDLSLIPDLKLTVGNETSGFGDFDIIITNKIHDKNKIIEYLQSGGNFIFIAPETFYKWEYDNLREILPVEIEMDGSKAKAVERNTRIISNAEEFKNIDFARYFLEIKKYYAAKNKNTTVLAQTEDGSVLISRNNGIFYVNFNTGWTNLAEIPTDICYVALWHNLIKSITPVKEIDCLCSALESEVMPGNLSPYMPGDTPGFEKIKAENKNYIFKYLLILGVLFLLIEMYYIKIRGMV